MVRRLTLSPRWWSRIIHRPQPLRRLTATLTGVRVDLATGNELLSYTQLHSISAIPGRWHTGLRWQLDTGETITQRGFGYRAAQQFVQTVQQYHA